MTMTKDTAAIIHDRFLESFSAALAQREAGERRIGAELKFPLVARNGEAVPEETVQALWRYLADNLWTLDEESGGRIVGARFPGEKNHTVASCETGYCKVEFSMAHVASLTELECQISALRRLLEPFADAHDCIFLAYGIHPVAEPHRRLLMKKNRSGVWDKAVPSNEVIPVEHGDDFHLFTLNAASHVHVSVAQEEAIKAVNVFNGFAPAQIALTGHSSVWRGKADPDYACVAEKLWDWWRPASSRCGMPEKAFTDTLDYVRTVSKFRPIYVKRDGGPVVLTDYESFSDYYGSGTARGRDLEGREVEVRPEPADIDVHNSCYWFNARISRYFTVENRISDQQPADDLMAPAAFSLGLATSLDEAWEEVAARDWAGLRRQRDEACRAGLATDDEQLIGLCEKALELADQGLRLRGLGEERFLAPMYQRLGVRENPGQQVRAIFEEGGIQGLLEARNLAAPELSLQS